MDRSEIVGPGGSQRVLENGGRGGNGQAALRFVVYGKPIAQARPKFFTRRSKAGKTFAGAYNPQESEAVKFGMSIRAQLPDKFVPIDGPIGLAFLFVMPIPASASKKKRVEMVNGSILPIKKPDLDNCIKFVKDSLNTIVWIDDSRICRIYGAVKEYGERPRTEIEVFQL